MGLLGIQQCKYDNLSDKYQIQQVELSTYKDSVTTYKTKTGELVYKVAAVEIERDNAKKGLEEAGFSIKKLRQENVNWRKVNLALQAELEASGSGSITLHDTTYIPTKGDTVTAQVGDWNNGFLYLSPFLVGNKLDFTYNYKVGLEIVAETKKTITIGLTDPKANITTSNAVFIKPNQKWWNKWYIYFIGGVAGGYFLTK